MDRVPNGAWKTSQIEGWEVVVGFHQTEYSLVVTVHHLIQDVHHMHACTIQYAGKSASEINE